MLGTTQQDWTTPGAHPVSPGVHRIPLPLPHDGLRAVNVYAVEDGDALTLVDGGWALAESERALEAALAGIGLSGLTLRPLIGALGFGVALFLGFAAGAVPAWNAYRSKITDMLRTV